MLSWRSQVGGAIPDGIVLAGGRGRRMGRPKADARIGGVTLVERAIAALRARCAEVVVVARPQVPMPDVAVPVLHDRPGPDAPLVGLTTGLAALGAREALVLACDLPFAGPALDALLARPAGTAVVAIDGGRAQPLCARYPRAAALAAADRLLARGRLPLDGLLQELSPELVEVAPGALLNVNTPQDLRWARRAVGDPAPVAIRPEGAPMTATCPTSTVATRNGAAA